MLFTQYFCFFPRPYEKILFPAGAKIARWNLFLESFAYPPITMKLKVLIKNIYYWKRLIIDESILRCRYSWNVTCNLCKWKMRMAVKSFMNLFHIEMFWNYWKMVLFLYFIQIIVNKTFNLWIISWLFQLACLIQLESNISVLTLSTFI